MKSIPFNFLFAVVIFLCGCSPYQYLVEVQPADALITINGQVFTNEGPFKSKEKEIRIEISKIGYQTQSVTIKSEKKNGLTQVDIILQPITYEVSISSLYNIYPSTIGTVKDFKISIDGTTVNTTPYYNNYSTHPNWYGEGLTFLGTLTHGTHTVSFSAAGYQDYTFPLEVTESAIMMVRHPKIFTTGPWEIVPKGVFDCGRQPKQTDITPDGKYIYIALLDGFGFQIFDVAKKQIVSYEQPEGYSKFRGFVEGLFIPKYNAYFVSQMTSASLFEYDVTDFLKPIFRRRIPVQGDWTKVIAYCPSLNIIAASNWLSNDISLMDYASGTVLHKLANLVEARGLVFSNDGKYLYVTTYAGGGIYKFNTSTWVQEGKIHIPNSAMRHIRISSDDKFLYVSSKDLSKIQKIDTASFTIVKTVDTDIFPNTIDITDDGRFLFVSDRGPNNPESYLNKSLEPGLIDIIDLSSFTLIGRITAGTQPTGLDVSPDGSFFVLSNFQDHTIELYGLKLKNGI